MTSIFTHFIYVSYSAVLFPDIFVFRMNFKMENYVTKSEILGRFVFHCPDFDHPDNPIAIL